MEIQIHPLAELFPMLDDKALQDLADDPFAGSGTTGRAATSQQRRFWGCDADEACARQRLQEEAAA